MFKYLLLKAIFDVSGVDVVVRSKYDKSFKYFLEMAPEDPVIDASSLTKFLRLPLQGATTIIAFNLKRILKLLNEKEGN